jgi:chloramphenicol O-acetyltransferase
MKKLIAVLILLLLFVFHAVSQTMSAQSELRVLFIGNSLTYTTDLPAMVKVIAEHIVYAVLDETFQEQYD